MDWNSETITGLIERALAEDVGAGDVTVAATLSARATGQAHILARQELVCAGLPLAARIFQALDPAMRVEMRANDGDLVAKNQEVLHLDGKAAALLHSVARNHALVDGNQIPDLPCPATGIVAGDQTEPAISAASIVAKVMRDELMRRLALRYPGYGWVNNAGYGTAQHRLSVQHLGLTPHHRRSFTTRFHHLHQGRPYG